MKSAKSVGPGCDSFSFLFFWIAAANTVVSVSKLKWLLFFTRNIYFWCKTVPSSPALIVMFLLVCLFLMTYILNTKAKRILCSQTDGSTGSQWSFLFSRHTGFCQRNRRGHVFCNLNMLSVVSEHFIGTGTTLDTGTLRCHSCHSQLKSMKDRLPSEQYAWWKYFVYMRWVFLLLFF